MKVTIVLYEDGLVAGVYANKNLARREISDYMDEGISRSIKQLEKEFGFEFMEQELITE